MKPSIGRIVIYNTTEQDQQAMRDQKINVQKQLPAMIVAVWSDDCINVKVFMDGGVPDVWKTSIHEYIKPVVADGLELDISLPNKEGTWEWPTIIK